MSFFDSALFHNLLTAAIVMLMAWVISFSFRKIFNSLIRRKFEKDDIKSTSLVFVKNSISFLVFSGAILFLFFTLEPLKGLGTAVFASAGIIAAVVGFASQKAMANIFGGVFILLFRPFHVGDIIKLSAEVVGVVEELTLRHTVIRDYENRRIIIPNSKISEETIINSTILDLRIRQHLHFGISYDSNIDKAIEIIRDEAERHPLCLDGRSPEDIEAGMPIVMVRVISHGDFSINLRAWVWSEDQAKSFELKCDLLKSVKERFDREGIEIPFPYRTLVFKDKDSHSIQINNHS